MGEKNQAVKKSIIDDYINLSLHNKTKSEVNTPDKKPKLSAAEIQESKAKIIAEIKTVTELVFPDKALNRSVYAELLPMMEAAAKVEQSSLDEQAQKKQAMRNAAILAVLFNNYKDALSYLKNYEP
jgi:hypothetical protein